MRVLPVGILLYAVPLSLLEAFLASLIIKMLTKRLDNIEQTSQKSYRDI
jgi:hypothetical protein